MKKIWGYVSAALGGIIAGMVIALKYLVPEKTVFKGRVRLKQSGRGNSQITDIRPEIDAKTKRDGTPKRSKEERKQDRVIKHNQKKRDKDNKRLEDG